MEDELFKALYGLIREESKRRPRLKRVQFTDAAILAVAFWSVLHDRPICWACHADHWHDDMLPWPEVPSPATMSRRLRTLSVQLLLEQVFQRLAWVHVLLDGFNPGPGFSLARTIDSKPLPVGGFSKDRDARTGYAAGGKCKGYKLFCCWGNRQVVPEAIGIGPMNTADPVGATKLIDRLHALHGKDTTGGYLLADAGHDTNALHDYAGHRGFQLLAPRKTPGVGLGHCPHSPYRLRCIELLEPPGMPLADPAATLGPSLYRERGRIERDFGNLGAFGGGLQPLPSWVRRPRRVAFWVIAKLILNGLRICRNHGLTP